MTEFDDALGKLVDDLFASLRVAEGVGLAAPQIGVDLAVFVYDCPDGTGERQVGHVVNPTIEVSGDPENGEEGCLSVPGPYHELPRCAAGHGARRRPHRSAGGGQRHRLLRALPAARDRTPAKGVLYIDHLPRNRRRRVLREMEPFDWNVVPG